MTKAHTTSTYQDGHKTVEFCKVCSAEGFELLEDCPVKFTNHVEKPLDEKNQTVK